MSLNESYPQHVVTAVIVAHDGVAWLPQVADAVREQTRPVQRIVAVDTGSRDRSGAVLASKFGQGNVFGMDRATGYGVAISRALQHRAAHTPVPPSPNVAPADRVEWLWFLHDDCEPAPDALEQLLRGAAETSAAAVLGPKIRDWTNRDVILEAGTTLDTATRRVTGIEPREVDQGQHDGDRDALAVSSAGMLVRRDVWDGLGGFDPTMALFMEDIDFCWRVHSAGYRVRVITDAVVYHVQAATKRRRPVSVGRRARMLDRRNGLFTLLGNLPMRQMVSAVAGNTVLSLLRIAFLLLAKRLTAALDEAAALAAVLGHPFRLFAMRRRRAQGRRAAYTRIRADLPPGRSVRRLAEVAASTLLRSAQADAAGAHHASTDPTDDDSMLEDNGLARRLLTSPALLTFTALLAVTLGACWSLIGSGPLGGGSLVPVWGGASDLWRTYIEAFHPTGIGSTTAAPPYLAMIAGLATLLGGKPWLAIDVILIGSVPLAGMTAMLAVRQVTRSRLVRVWAAASYALLPVAFGVIAAGRFGTAVAFVLLPLIALLAGRIFTSSGTQASRAAWAAGLLVAIGAAFVPLLWLFAVVACVMAAAGVRTTRPGTLRNVAVVVLTGPVLLLPWSLSIATHPSQLLLEAGLPQPGTPAAGLPARALMLLSPGGPGLPPYWVTGGLVVAALAALFAGRRRRLIMAGWGAALAGLLAAIGVSHVVITPADGGQVVVWAGLPLAIAAIGLLLAAAAAADGLSRRLSARRAARLAAMLDGSKGGRTRIGRAPTGRAAAAHAVGAGQRDGSTGLGGRRVLGFFVALAACSAPLLAAGWWVSTGVRGPVHPVTSQVVPELVSVGEGRSQQVRTLVLHSGRGGVSYLLLREPSPGLADASLSPPPAARLALAKAVAVLIAPGGAKAVNLSRTLAEFDIGYILVQAPVDPQLAGVLNDVNGLRLYSSTHGYELWQLAVPPARVSVLEPNGALVPIPSGPIGVSGTHVPAAGGTLLLAEPTGGWSASVNGQPLAQVPSPAGAWAQAFHLPAGGGVLSVGHSGLGHDALLVSQLIVFLALVGLAFPGIRVAEGEEAPAAASAKPAEGTPARGAPDRAQDELTAKPTQRPAELGEPDSPAALPGWAAASRLTRAAGRGKGRAARVGRASRADRAGRTARGADADRADRASRAGRVGRVGLVGRAGAARRGRAGTGRGIGEGSRRGGAAREQGAPGRPGAFEPQARAWPYAESDLPAGARGAGTGSAGRLAPAGAPGAGDEGASRRRSVRGGSPAQRRSPSGALPPAAWPDEVVADWSAGQARGDQYPDFPERAPAERSWEGRARQDQGWDDRRRGWIAQRPAVERGYEQPGQRTWSPSGRRRAVPEPGDWPDDGAGPARGPDAGQGGPRGRRNVWRPGGGVDDRRADPYPGADPGSGWDRHGEPGDYGRPEPEHEGESW